MLYPLLMKAWLHITAPDLVSSSVVRYFLPLQWPTHHRADPWAGWVKTSIDSGYFFQRSQSGPSAVMFSHTLSRKNALILTFIIRGNNDLFFTVSLNILELGSPPYPNFKFTVIGFTFKRNYCLLIIKWLYVREIHKCVI